jgi:uncharacterized membrane protein
VRATGGETGRAGARGQRASLGLLRRGFQLSMALVGLGTLVMFARHPSYLSSGAELAGLTQVAGAAPHSLASVARGVARGRGEAITMLGLLLLLLTPVARLVATAAGFARRGERPFVVLAAAVLAIIAASLVLGQAAGA